METLAALPAPGLAIFPNMIPQTPRTFIMKGEYVGGSYNISTSDGKPFLTIDSEYMSASHRKHVIDTSGRKLCTIRRETWTMHTRYYAEIEEGGQRVFDFESHSGFTGSKNSLKFANAAANGQPAQLDFKNNAFGSKGTVTWQGTPVAVIESKKFKMRTEYHLHIAPGLDPFLVIAITVSLDDKVKSNRSGGAAAGAGGASAGAGC